MKNLNQTLALTATALTTALLLCPGAACAADIPVPVFYVKGDKLTAGAVPSEVPHSASGVIAGTVSSDGEALVFDGTGGVGDL